MTLADPPASPDAQRFAQVDELRGIAAVLVLVLHAASTFAPAALAAGAGLLFRPAALLAAIAALIALFAALMFGLLPAASRLEWQSMPLNLAFMLWGALFHATRFRPPRGRSRTPSRRFRR